MKHLAAYLLAVLGGNAAPTPADIEKIVKAGGSEPDSEAVTRLLAAVEGKDIAELIEAGKKKLVSVGGGGGGGGGGGAAPAAGGAAAAGGAKEAKKEEKKVEEEEDAGGAGGLFGGDDDDW